MYVLDRPNRGILGVGVGEVLECQCRHAENASVPLNQRKSAETNWRLPFMSVARSAVPIHFHALVMAGEKTLEGTGEEKVAGVNESFIIEDSLHTHIPQIN